MRPSISFITTAAVAVAGTAYALAVPVADPKGLAARQSDAAGFLSATFLGDVPHVFLHYSNAANPVTFTAVQGSQGELVPTLGTGGARDPYIFHNQVDGNVS